MLKMAGKDYQFFASISAGECTFFEAFAFLEKVIKNRKIPLALKKIGHDLKLIIAEKDWEKRVINILMGLVQDISGAINDYLKTAFKEYIAEGNDKEKFTAFLLMRTSESRHLFEENIRLKEENARLKKELEKIIKIVK